MKPPGVTPIRAYAVIVDINHFAAMVSAAVTGPSRGELIADFVSRTLTGAIDAIEFRGGHVMGVMGDAVFGVLSKGDAIFDLCEDIARSVNEASLRITCHQAAFPDAWHYSPGGPSLKICIEFGWMDIATITTRQLGTQKLLIGQAINCASRLGQAGTGNRCLVGPVAAGMLDLSPHAMRGPFNMPGKADEPDIICYELDLDTLWRTVPHGRGGRPEA